MARNVHLRAWCPWCEGTIVAVQLRPDSTRDETCEIGDEDIVLCPHCARPSTWVSSIGCLIPPTVQEVKGLLGDRVALETWSDALLASVPGLAALHDRGDWPDGEVRCPFCGATSRRGINQGRGIVTLSNGYRSFCDDVWHDR